MSTDITKNTKITFLIKRQGSDTLLDVLENAGIVQVEERIHNPSEVTDPILIQLLQPYSGQIPFGYRVVTYSLHTTEYDAQQQMHFLYSLGIRAIHWDPQSGSVIALSWRLHPIASI